MCVVIAGAGVTDQRRLQDLDASISRIVGLHLVSDYQTNPLIEGSVYLAERTVGRILGRR
jgi:hypothetical protein